MTATHLVPVEPAHYPELGRILHDAFGALHDRHQVERDFPSLEAAVGAITFLAGRPDFVGVAAMSNDGGTGERLVGSNFLALADAIAGVGPITVDPHVQARGVGRSLMKHVIDEARQRERREVRLFQEAINGPSLSLYTSLGFSWVDSAAQMTLPKPAAAAGHVRPMTQADLPHVAALSEQGYGFAREQDARVLLGAEMPGFVSERGGHIVAYFFPSLIGHGAARSDEDLIDLLAGAAAHVPGYFNKYICPLSEVALFRQLLSRGARVIKMMNYMSLGERYQRPPGTWLPSILC